jgi:IS1 family transposase
VRSALSIYRKAKAAVGRIAHIYTDANSCYAQAFKGIPEPHTMTKAQTHLIESSNSSLRDNLARFNRRTKRYTKSLEMLRITLDMFLNRHLWEFEYKIAIFC